MPTYTGKAGIIDDVIFQGDVNLNTNNTITGFTSEDFIFFERNMTALQNAKFSDEVTRSGNDLVFKLINTISDKVTSAVTLKGVYGTDGLEFLSAARYKDGHLDIDSGFGSLAILKSYTTSSQASEYERSEINWPAMFVCGTSASETIYAATNGYSLIYDGDGDDRAYGGLSNRFINGLGNDTLTGGSGDDTYNFDRLSCFAKKGKLEYIKTITNFDASDGDEIDLSRIAFNHKMLFTEARTSANWKRGDIIFEKNGSDGWLLGNTDKDKDPEIKIVLVGVTTFNANDSLNLSL